ncbi:MAG: hypothetical protein PVF43_15230, partial [Candidatus Eiseniibacteriota bacterium]
LLLLRRRLLEVLPAVLVVVLTVILYAFVFLGANPRHMQMFYPFLFTCAAAGLVTWRHWTLWWCLFFMALVAGSTFLLTRGL